MTEYFSASKRTDVPKKIRENVKMACTAFIALDSRPFELIAGDGCMNMAQSIFDAGKHFSVSSNVNFEQLIPSPITVNRH